MQKSVLQQTSKTIYATTALDSLRVLSRGGGIGCVQWSKRRSGRCIAEGLHGVVSVWLGNCSRRMLHRWHSISARENGRSNFLQQQNDSKTIEVESLHSLHFFLIGIPYTSRRTDRSHCSSCTALSKVVELKRRSWLPARSIFRILRPG